MTRNHLNAAEKHGVLFSSGLILPDAASANIVGAGKLFAFIDDAGWAELDSDASALEEETS